MSRRISSCRSVSSSIPCSPRSFYFSKPPARKLLQNPHWLIIHVALYTVYAKDCPSGHGRLLCLGRAARQSGAARQAARGGRPPGGTGRGGGGELRGAG